MRKLSNSCCQNRQKRLITLLTSTYAKHDSISEKLAQYAKPCTKRRPHTSSTSSGHGNKGCLLKATSNRCIIPEIANEAPTPQRPQMSSVSLMPASLELLASGTTVRSTHHCRTMVKACILVTCRSRGRQDTKGASCGTGPGDFFTQALLWRFEAKSTTTTTKRNNCMELFEYVHADVTRSS